MGQVWLSVRCEDEGGGGDRLFPHGLIPTGATAHSHCGIGLIAQMKAEGRRRRGEREWGGACG